VRALDPPLASSAASIPPSVTWLSVDANRAASLAAARLVLHHAMQLPSGFGLAYARPQDDDSHSSLRWDVGREALRSPAVQAPVGSVALGLRLGDLTLLLLIEGSVLRELPLAGVTNRQAQRAVQEWMSMVGLDAARYTLRRHFEIPPHDVVDGAPFPDTLASELQQWHVWIANASDVLAGVASEMRGGAVQLWPHHADIATLIALPGGRTTGVGLAMGDTSYPVPYFYVNAYPSPPLASIAAALEGGGHWHHDGWIGAVLPGSRLADGASEQHQQVLRFFASALAVTTQLPFP
jgi:hypothetical protein